MIANRFVFVLAAVSTLPPVAAGEAGSEGGYVVEATDIDAWRVLPAHLRGEDRAGARARIGGLIERLIVEEGDEVSAGDEIAVVSDPTLDERLAAAEGALERSAAEQDAAAEELRRMRRLFEEDVVARARLDEAERRFSAAQGATDQARSEIEVLEARRRRGAVLAPSGGVVVSAPLSEGAAVDRGQTVAEIATTPIRLRLSAPERHAGALSVGDRLEVETPDGLRIAEVVRIYPEIEAGRIEVDLALPASSLRRFVGRTLGVRVKTGSRRAIVVPRRFVWTDDGLAYVRREVGRTLVRTGRTWPKRVEIVSGLRPGDVLLPPDGASE